MRRAKLKDRIQQMADQANVDKDGLDEDTPILNTSGIKFRQVNLGTKNTASAMFLNDYYGATKDEDRSGNYISLVQEQGAGRAFGSTTCETKLIGLDRVYGQNLRVFSGVVTNCKNPKSQRPRACIIAPPADSGIDITADHLHTDKDVAAADMRDAHGKVTKIVSAYCDINLDPPEKLIQVIRAVKKDGIPCILGIDSNAHSEMWGNPGSNARGLIWERIIEDYGLTIENCGERLITFHGIGEREANTAIDLTLTTAAAADRITDWEVLVDDNGSDHYTIGFNYQMEYVPKKQFYQNIKRADWAVFKDAMRNSDFMKIDIESIKTKEQMDIAGEIAQRNFTTGSEECNPSKPALPRVPKPWWTDELTELRKARGREYRKKGKGKENEFKLACERFDKALREKQQESWRNFLSEDKDSKDTSFMVKLMEGKLRKTTLGLIKDTTGEFTKNTKESLDALLGASVPMGVDDGTTPYVFKETSGLPRIDTSGLKRLHDLNLDDCSRLPEPDMKDVEVMASHEKVIAAINSDKKHSRWQF